MQDDDFGGLTASPAQKKMYFGLMRKLGYDGETAKAILKKKLMIESFADVTSGQLTPIIDTLKKKVEL